MTGRGRATLCIFGGGPTLSSNSAALKLDVSLDLADPRVALVGSRMWTATACRPHLMQICRPSAALSWPERRNELRRRPATSPFIGDNPFIFSTSRVLHHKGQRPA